MDQNPLATSVCVPSPQETPQYQNQQEQQEQKRQQRMMLYGAPTPIASPERSQHQISSEQFHEPQHTQQPYRQPESASIKPKYQLDGDRPQDEKRDAIQSGSYTSVNRKNTKSPHSFHSDSSIHPSENASKQSSPYMSPQNQFLNHTNNKYELSTTDFQPPQQGMACIRPPNTIPVLAQDLHPSYYQSQKEYSVGHKHAFFYQQHRPRLTTTVWEDEGTLCFQVDAKGICVARRQDNNMVNGTKLLNVVGMSRGKRDGILKNEKRRVVVKVGAMHLKGVWITLERAKHLSAQFHILNLLYPLFVDEPNEFLFSPGHDSIFPFSPPISQLLQDGPGNTQRQSSPLYTSGIMGHTLGLGRQPPMFPGPTAVIPAERVHCTGAKFSGRNSSQSDMYLQFPAMGIDLRGSGNSACFQHPNGGYPSSFPPHFPNHSFKDNRPPSTPSTTSRYMTATGGTFAATDSTYIGEPNVEISNAPQYEQHLNSCQHQNQLDQHRQTLHAMSSEPNGIQARNTHSKYATSPKPAPSNANITSLTFLSPIDGMYRPNDVPQMLLEISRTGCGSEAPSLDKFETRKRGHDNGPIASTQTSCISGNNFPSPLSVSPPATPTQHPSEDLTQFHSCSPPSPKRFKPEQLDQALLQANGLSSQQQFLPSLPNVKESSGEKQHDQSHNINGQCLPCTNGLKVNVPSSNEQGVDPEQSIPPPLQLYRLPQTKSNPLDINQSSYDLGDEPSDISTGTVQQNEPLNQY